MPQISIDYSVDLGSIANMAAVLVATMSIVAGLVAIKRQIAVTIFNEYSHRYHEIMRRFPVKMWASNGVKIDAFSTEEVDRLMTDYADFFRLLAGERHLKTLNAIDKKTWRLWMASTSQLMSQPLSKEMWRRLRPGFSYDPQFQKFVDSYSDRRSLL